VNRPKNRTIAIVTGALLLSGVTAGQAPAVPDTAAAAPAVATSKQPRLHATRGDAPGIYDSRGRHVLLHGVAVNQLGDYYQVDPKRKTTFPLRRRDFRRIHALGFNVVRLIVHWSRVEPQPGKSTRATSSGSRRPSAGRAGAVST